MTNLDYCNDCGKIPISKIKENCQGLYCENCDIWLVVTTYLKPIFHDTVYYTLTIEPMNLNKKQLSFLAKLMNHNYLAIHKKMKQNIPLTTKRDAIATLELIPQFQQLDIDMSITPKFLWIDEENQSCS